MEKLLYIFASRRFLFFLILCAVNVGAVIFYSNIVSYLYGLVETPNLSINKAIYGIITGCYLLIYLACFFQVFFSFPVWGQIKNGRLYLGHFTNIYVLILIVLLFMYFLSDGVTSDTFYFFYFLLPLIPGGVGVWKGWDLIQVEKSDFFGEEEKQERGNPFRKEDMGDDFFSRKKSNNFNLHEEGEQENSPFVAKEFGEDFFEKRRREKEVKKEAKKERKGFFTKLAEMFQGDTAVQDEKEASPFVQKNPFEDTSEDIFKAVPPEALGIDKEGNSKGIEEEQGGGFYQEESGPHYHSFAEEDNEEEDSKGGFINTNIDIEEVLEQEGDSMNIMEIEEEEDVVDLNKIGEGDFFTIEEDEDEDEDMLFTEATTTDTTSNLIEGGEGVPAKVITPETYSKYYIKNFPLEKVQDVDYVEKLLRAL